VRERERERDGDKGFLKWEVERGFDPGVVATTMA